MGDCFFVICNHPNEKIRAIPLMDEFGENLALFNSRHEADMAARGNDFALVYGWYIYQLGEGA